MQAALAELRETIAAAHPDAIFDGSEGDDPAEVCLNATVDVEGTDEVAAL